MPFKVINYIIKISNVCEIQMDRENILKKLHTTMVVVETSSATVEVSTTSSMSTSMYYFDNFFMVMSFWSWYMDTNVNTGKKFIVYYCLKIIAYLSGNIWVRMNSRSIKGLVSMNKKRCNKIRGGEFHLKNHISPL